MNFLIDGAYGDLYRAAMFETQQLKSNDEWDIERRIAEIDAQPRHARCLTMTARISRLVTALLAAVSHQGRQAVAPRHLSPRA